MPEREPYFLNAKSFADVQIGQDGIDITDVLEATECLLHTFNLLNSPVFTFAESDLRGNLRTVQRRCAESPSSSTLEKYVAISTDEGKVHAKQAMINLLRGLYFTQIGLKSSRENPNQELSASFRYSYDIVLRSRHNFIVRSLVGIAFRALPRRQDFYTRLADGATQEELQTEMVKWLQALEDIVNQMKTFLEINNYEPM